jgi:hypothetical protein
MKNPIPRVHPKWGPVPPFHPKWGKQGYRTWLALKEREALRAENKRRRARGLQPKRAARIPLPIDKLVMRINREFQLRKSHSQNADAPLRQVYVHPETGEAFLYLRRVAKVPASHIFPGHKLGPGLAEDMSIENSGRQRPVDLIALGRKLRCIYLNESVGGWGGWSRIKPFDGPKLRKPRPSTKEKHP